MNNCSNTVISSHMCPKCHVVLTLLQKFHLYAKHIFTKYCTFTFLYVDMELSI